MKKIILVTILFLLSNCVFSQEGNNKQYTEISYLVILNHKIPSNIRINFINLDSNFTFNFGCQNLSIRLIESEFDYYSKCNPDIKVKIEIIEKSGNNIISTYLFYGKLNDLINKDYNIIEIIDKPLDNYKFIYRYETPKYRQSYKWKKTYSSVDY